MDEIVRYGCVESPAFNSNVSDSPFLCVRYLQSIASPQWGLRIIPTHVPKRDHRAFSKKLEKYCAAFALYAMYYNFCRPHPTLTKQLGNGKNKVPTTPAMASGLTDHAWTVEEMLKIVLDSK